MLENEGYQFMGAAFEVYNELGYGMAEEIYQQSLEIELALRQIPFQNKSELQVFYKDNLLDTRYKPDLVASDSIVVELKAISDLNSDHEAQLFNYMRISRQPVGYLLNFGKKGGLQWHRFVLSDLHARKPDAIALVTASEIH
jgi:GxxExxY protein